MFKKQYIEGQCSGPATVTEVQTFAPCDDASGAASGALVIRDLNFVHVRQVSDRLHLRARGRNQRLAAMLVVACVLAATALTVLVLHYRQLAGKVDRLSSEVVRLQKEQSAPAQILAQHRESICYVYAEYDLTPPEGRGPTVHLKTSGTGFVVKDGVIATSRHVLEAGFESAVAQQYLREGAMPRRKKMLAYFPGNAVPAPLMDVQNSSTADLAVARFALPDGARRPHPLALADGAPAAGEAVVVVGYPLGVAGMVAKSPQQVYERLALKEESAGVASELATLSLIRPSATFGHVGDVVGDKLMYDAPTAHGGSGGPVFDMDGRVVGVNAAYVTGFVGGSLGISADELKALLRAIH